MARAGTGSGEQSSRRPQFVKKMAPCGFNCPNHNMIRPALMMISKAEDYNESYDDAIAEAWHLFLQRTPFPAVLGRVCPHPCETECNRTAKEGAVSINAMERFIGDFGIEKGLKPRKLTDEKRSEKIAIIGSGPAGMSCAYQLARRGYPVTVFEAFPKSGGMLRYGIPDYRLPQSVLDAEVNRILDMGVELKLNTAVGRDIPYDDIKKDYKAVFVGLGAHQGYKLGVAGEDAANVMTGTAFLNAINSGESVDVGKKVVVIGGGDTAIDAARVSRRLGADVTILYRRTREEMPAIDEEIEGGLEETVRIDYLAAPIEIYKDGDRATGMKCQRMELGEPDASGRRRPVPIDGDTYDLEFDTLIAAISQEPDFTGLDHLREGRDWIKVDEHGKTKDDNVYAGGDNINLGIAITAIYQGRLAAEAIDAAIKAEPITPPEKIPVIRHDKMKLDFYEEKKRNEVVQMAVEERLKKLDAEISETFTQETAIDEAKRCMSCGMCFDCGSCWSFCQDNAIIKPLIKTRGEQYKFKLEFCKGCDKCAENCPCGYIEMH